ncbi:histone-lysine N-methyltransferase PR-Set7 [Wyeomyia smithii]|uniref:histone-lysine N-methyltransferase PR-Set7 n=1 Tax=Wyeomyia smithii TaxID=174621 RepID=UPI002467B2C8|nr:histone-lysine N-methyltransferase PR-Set7 [Wyeomyia smithii]
MGKGRRTRQTNPVSQLLAKASAMDDTASPKRKDFKYDGSMSKTSQSSPVNTANNSRSTTGTTEGSMILRASRSKTNGIAKYFTNFEKPLSTPVSVPVTRTDNFIDLTDENTCDSFENITNGVAATPTNNSSFAALGFNAVKSNPACNIFLQEPVLTLNIDKTSTDQSRVIIKSSFLTTEIQNKFSPPKCEPIWSSAPVKRDVGEDHALDLSMPTQVTSIDSTTFLNQDSNSCDSGDSGVVISTEKHETVASFDEKKRKPATPHRILCPSPVKNPIVASPSKALAHLNIQSKRATRRNAKSKRRLHTKELENALEETVVQQTADNSFPVAIAPTISAKELLDKKKPVLNDSVNPTAQQNTNNNQSSKVSEAPKIPTTKTGGKAVDPAVTGNNKKLTDFFQVRRSVRKTKKEVQWERDRDIEKAIREERDFGLKIAYFDGKGRGIVTTRPFMKGEFVVEYIGDFISVSEAKQREQIYAEDDNTGCYMYYFKHKNVQYCIDATAESGKLGRLVNHSRNGNLMTKTVSLNNRPHLVLIAKEDIAEGVEVTYDYGDRSKEALQHHPWLAF